MRAAALALLLTACGGGDSHGTVDTMPAPVIVTPHASPQVPPPQSNGETK